MGTLTPLRMVAISLAFAVILIGGTIAYEIARGDSASPSHVAAAFLGRGTPAAVSASPTLVSLHSLPAQNASGVLSAHPQTTQHAAASVTPTDQPARPPTPVATATDAPTATATPRPALTATSTVPNTATPTATPFVPLQLDNTRFSLYTVNPQFTKQHVSFMLSKKAHIVVKIRPQGQTTPVRTFDLGMQPAGKVNVRWDGRDNAHAFVPEGQYSYLMIATDQSGAQVTESFNDLGITYKRLVVSLSRQQLTAYDGKTVFLSSLVTTGNAALPTPLGVFPILGLYHPFTMTSPWPKGSKFYYAPSQVNYAILFDDRGYYVHDAPWRTYYGPGSNATVGVPGLNATGTHGCVNVPFAAEQQLFNWVTIGTIVQVVR